MSLLKVDLSAKRAHNLKVLQGINVNVLEIVEDVSHVVVYRFDHLKSNKWERIDVEGSAFITRNTTPPFYFVFVLNKKGPVDFVLSIETILKVRIQEAFIMIKCSAPAPPPPLVSQSSGSSKSIKNKKAPAPAAANVAVPDANVVNPSSIFGLWMHSSLEREALFSALKRLSERARRGVQLDSFFSSALAVRTSSSSSSSASFAIASAAAPAATPAAAPAAAPSVEKASSYVETHQDISNNSSTSGSSGSVLSLTKTQQIVGIPSVKLNPNGSSTAVTSDFSYASIVSKRDGTAASNPQDISISDERSLPAAAFATETRDTLQTVTSRDTSTLLRQALHLSPTRRADISQLPQQTQAQTAAAQAQQVNKLRELLSLSRSKTVKSEEQQQHYQAQQRVAHETGSVANTTDEDISNSIAQILCFLSENSMDGAFSKARNLIGFTFSPSSVPPQSSKHLQEHLQWLQTQQVNRMQIFADCVLRGSNNCSPPHKSSSSNMRGGCVGVVDRNLSNGGVCDDAGMKIAEAETRAGAGARDIVCETVLDTAGVSATSAGLDAALIAALHFSQYTMDRQHKQGQQQQQEQNKLEGSAGGEEEGFVREIGSYLVKRLVDSLLGELRAPFLAPGPHIYTPSLNNNNDDDIVSNVSTSNVGTITAISTQQQQQQQLQGTLFNSPAAAAAAAATGEAQSSSISSTTTTTTTTRTQITTTTIEQQPQQQQFIDSSGTLITLTSTEKKRRGEPFQSAAATAAAVPLLLRILYLFNFQVLYQDLVSDLLHTLCAALAVTVQLRSTKQRKQQEEQQQLRLLRGKKVRKERRRVEHEENRENKGAPPGPSLVPHASAGTNNKNKNNKNNISTNSSSNNRSSSIAGYSMKTYEKPLPLSASSSSFCVSSAVANKPSAQTHSPTPTPTPVNTHTPIDKSGTSNGTVNIIFEKFDHSSNSGSSASNNGYYGFGALGGSNPYYSDPFSASFGSLTGLESNLLPIPALNVPVGSLLEPMLDPSSELERGSSQMPIDEPPVELRTAADDHREEEEGEREDAVNEVVEKEVEKEAKKVEVELPAQLSADICALARSLSSSYSSSAAADVTSIIDKSSVGQLSHRMAQEQQQPQQPTQPQSQREVEGRERIIANEMQLIELIECIVTHAGLALAYRDPHALTLAIDILSRHCCRSISTSTSTSTSSPSSSERVGENTEGVVQLMRNTLAYVEVNNAAGSSDDKDSLSTAGDGADGLIVQRRQQEQKRKKSAEKSSDGAETTSKGLTPNHIQTSTSRNNEINNNNNRNLTGDRKTLDVAGKARAKPTTAQREAMQQVQRLAMWIQQAVSSSQSLSSALTSFSSSSISLAQISQECAVRTRLSKLLSYHENDCLPRSTPVQTITINTTTTASDANPAIKTPHPPTGQLLSPSSSLHQQGPQQQQQQQQQQQHPVAVMGYSGPHPFPPPPAAYFPLPFYPMQMPMHSTPPMYGMPMHSSGIMAIPPHSLIPHHEHSLFLPQPHPYLYPYPIPPVPSLSQPQSTHPAAATTTATGAAQQEAESPRSPSRSPITHSTPMPSLSPARMVMSHPTPMASAHPEGFGTAGLGLGLESGAETAGEARAHQQTQLRDPQPSSAGKQNPGKALVLSLLKGSSQSSSTTTTIAAANHAMNVNTTYTNSTTAPAAVGYKSSTVESISTDASIAAGAGAGATGVAGIEVNRAAVSTSKKKKGKARAGKSEGGEVGAGVERAEDEEVDLFTDGAIAAKVRAKTQQQSPARRATKDPARSSSSSSLLQEGTAHTALATPPAATSAVQIDRLQENRSQIASSSNKAGAAVLALITRPSSTSTRETTTTEATLAAPTAKTRTATTAARTTTTTTTTTSTLPSRTGSAALQKGNSLKQLLLSGAALPAPIVPTSRASSKSNPSSCTAVPCNTDKPVPPVQEMVRGLSKSEKLIRLISPSDLLK